MQISAIGKQLRSKRLVVRVLQPGFSLIELLVVMFLIALLGAVAVLAIGGRSQSDDTLHLAAARLLDLMTMASTQSIIISRPVGMHWFAPESADAGWQVRWSQWQQGQWRVLTDGPAPFQLPAQVQVALQVEGNTVTGSIESAADSNMLNASEQLEILPLPSLVFYGTGEVTPFALELSAEAGQQVSGTRVQVSNLRTGEIVIER